MTLRIDAHHHLWRYTAAEFDWLHNDELAPLQRDFLIEEFQQEMQCAKVQGCVAVQARQTVEETAWLLQLARDTPEMLGVVGWADLAHEDFAEVLEQLVERPFLKGLRHVVQAEPAGFLDRPAFNDGIGRLAHSGIVYDILIVEEQIEEAVRFVDRHPAQSFVLDHIGKPCIRKASIARWSRTLRELAQRPNITCKLSGMVTEADPRNWNAAQLEPYFDAVLEAFTPRRLMAGSDWPVLLAASSYAAWWQLVSEWVKPLTTDEQEAILGATAVRTYGLQLTPER